MLGTGVEGGGRMMLGRGVEEGGRCLGRGLREGADAWERGEGGGQLFDLLLETKHIHT